MPLYRAPNAALPCTKCRFTVHQMPLYRAPNAALQNQKMAISSRFRRFFFL